MKREDVEALAAYNAEVARGMVFPLEVQKRMAGLQREFDAPAELAAKVSPSIKARCQLCGSVGVGGIIHVAGCGGSTPEFPLEFLGYERTGEETG